VAKRPTLDGRLGQAVDGVSGPSEKDDKIASAAEKRLRRLRAASRAAEAAIERERQKGAVEEEAEAEAKTQIYVVKAGDTLSKIAGELMGDPKRWKEIFEANRDQIKNPDLIEIGWKLRIPEAS
jgi:nucleoid-associated protein YgaU